MTPAQSIETTVRAARLMKVLAGLVGVKDEIVASLVVSQAIDELHELAEFTQKLKQIQKGDNHATG